MIESREKKNKVTAEKSKSESSKVSGKTSGRQKLTKNSKQSTETKPFKFVNVTSSQKASPKNLVAEADSEAALETETLQTRLNVFLQSRGHGSRRKCDGLISQGKVSINGKIITKLGTMVDAGSVVKVSGLLVENEIKKCYFLLNKPIRTLTSRSDTQNRPTIFELPQIKKLAPNVQSVGRLDFNSEGLILLTNDGDMAYALTHPKFAVEKSYAVLTSDVLTPTDLESLRAGVELDDGFAKPLRVKTGSKQTLGVSKGQWVEVVVTEGRNRLIRRIFEAVGLKVLRLVRVAIGKSTLSERHKPGDVLPIPLEDLKYFEKIKHQMMLEEGKTKGSVTKTKDSISVKKPVQSKPSERDLKIRKMKRTTPLGDEAHAQELVRRSLALEERRKSRKHDAERAETVTESRPQNVSEITDESNHPQKENKKRPKSSKFFQKNAKTKGTKFFKKK